MARTKPATKTITMPSAPEEAVPEPVTQGKQPDGGRFRLQVDQAPLGGECDLGDQLAGREQEGPVVEIHLDHEFGAGLQLGDGLQFGHCWVPHEAGRTSMVPPNAYHIGTLHT